MALSLTTVATGDARLLYGTAYKFVQQVPRNAFRELTLAEEEAEDENDLITVRTCCDAAPAHRSRVTPTQMNAAEEVCNVLSRRVEKLCREAIGEITATLLPVVEDGDVVRAARPPTTSHLTH